MSYFCFRKIIRSSLITTKSQKCAENPCYVSLKNLKVLSQKSCQPSKRDRLLLREYRLRRWINFAETEVGKPASIGFGANKRNSHSNAPTTSQQPTKATSRTMQERALSNLSKIEAALVSNSFSPQQEAKNLEPLFRSADSGVWCDLTNEKNNKLLELKGCSNAKNTNRQYSDSCKQNVDSHSLRNEKYCKNYRSGMDDLAQNSFSSCSFYPSGIRKRTKRPHIVACSWYQNSKCISQTNVHSESFQKTFPKNTFDTSKHQVFLPYQQENPVAGSILQHLGGAKVNRKKFDHIQNDIKPNKNISGNLEKNLRTSLSISDIPSEIHHEDGSDKTTGEKNFDVLHNDSESQSGSLKSASTCESSHHAKRHNIVCCERTPTFKRNAKTLVYKNSFKRKYERPNHCDALSSYFSQNHSTSSRFNSNRFPTRFQEKPLSKRKQLAWNQRRQLCSCLPDSYDVSNYGLYFTKPVQSCNSLYRTSEPGLIALTNGKSQAILLKCSCKDCTKYSCRTYRPSRGVSQTTPSRKIRQRTKPSKNEKQHRKAHCRKVLSSKSNKTNFSSSTRLSNFGIWAMCFRCLDDDSSSSLSGGSDTCNDDGDGGDEGGDDVGFAASHRLLN